MYTYQDLEKTNERDKAEFARQVITNHKQTIPYKVAKDADDYMRQMNTTIMKYKKLLYTVTGKAVPDTYSANYKLTSNFFNRIITQENQFLLGNGVMWQNDDTRERLGDDFEIKLQRAGKWALCGGVSFGFWNVDHVEVFPITEFVPLWDEEDGALKAGVRFWQIDAKKPLRATLYELDGYTEYMWKEGKESVLKDKTPYKLLIQKSEADGETIYAFENYPTFPIVPLWANDLHQSELIGMRDNIDAYDLIKSGFCNTVDEASMIYWTIQNAGGMDDVDLAKFIERMKTVHASVIDDDGAKAESHSIEAPYASREALLDRLEKDIYKDAMALNTDTIASGATTATQIRASYEPLNNKVDDYEYQVVDFIQGILTLAGIEDTPTFTRSMMINTQEEVQTVLQASQYLDTDYVTTKILNLLGDGDKAEEVLKNIDIEGADRFMNEMNE